MPASNETTVNRDKNGYYRTYVPKPLADAMLLGDKEVGWKAVSGSALIMMKDPPEGMTTTTVNQTTDGYYRTRIPKALADSHDLAEQTVTWTVESGNALRMGATDE